MFSKNQKIQELERENQLLKVKLELQSNNYKDQKEVIDRQQNIDYLLVLSNIYTAQLGVVPNTPFAQKVQIKIEETIDKIK